MIALIIDNNSTNWYDILSDVDLDVHVSPWRNIELTSYSDSGPYVKIYPADNPIKGSNQDKVRIIKPSFLMVRNVIKGPTPEMNFANKLFGFMHTNTPSINSLSSIYACLERPIVYGKLKEIQKKLGNDKFPLIDQNYYSDHSEMIITPDYPLVAKIGHSHAGFGKMLLDKNDQFDDLRSVVALYHDYITVERFIESDYELRIQKVGSHISAYKRMSFEWKRNTGGALLEDIEVLPRYKTWIKECDEAFGGLDIMSLDVMVDKDGNEVILEMNDTATGLNRNKPEDIENLKKLVTDKMKELEK